MRPLDENAVIDLTAKTLLPSWQSERTKLDDVDRWARWNHKDPYTPTQRQETANRQEHAELVGRAQAPWGDLIVGSVSQTLYLEGYRRPSSPEDSTGWKICQANGLDGRQVSLHRAVLTYGQAYGTVLPGKAITGEPMPKMRFVSPRDGLALYDDPVDDEFPVFFLAVRKVRAGYKLRVFDETNVYEMHVSDLHDRPTKVDTFEHGVGVTPVVRYTNREDLEGRCAGEIEPFVPLLGRIDQTVYDRLVVQRFGAWIVRTIAGLDVKATADANNMTQAQVTALLRMGDFLTAKDPETKFGSLPATPLDGYIKAEERDLTDLAAVSQTPAFEALGAMINMSAEALDAAKDSQNAKSDERRHVLGEQHERFIRLGCWVAGDREGAADFESQVRWKDTSIRSLAQAADAFGKMATQLGFPVKLLWRKVPGLTQLDLEEAEELAAANPPPMQALANELAAVQGPVRAAA